MDMMKRCDICLEETCGGTYNCNCTKCKVKMECTRFLHATIRITNKCTQECSHCCFSSSPKSEIMMSVETAKYIGKFLRINEIKSLNVMGGEFFCNPDWYEILSLFLESSRSVRLVTNGDWTKNDAVKSSLICLVNSYKDILRIHVSKDRWHTNLNSDSAVEFLTSIGCRTKVTDPEEDNVRSIVPIGRSYLEYGFYSSIGTYCTSPSTKYSFLIDEEGDIYKCSFGAWRYANIKDYIVGGFNERFKEFNKKFYSLFIPSCRSCINSSMRGSDSNRCVRLD